MKRFLYIPTIIFTAITFLFGNSSISTAQTGKWIKLEPENSPPARTSFGMAHIGDDNVIIFGGHSNDGLILDDTWIFDLSENKWTEIESEIKPTKRIRHNMVQIDETRFFYLEDGIQTMA